MKKIYILTAVFALLTLSLNAQTILNTPKANGLESANKSLLAPIPGKNPTTGKFNAPMRADLADDEYILGPYTSDAYNTTGWGLTNVTTLSSASILWIGVDMDLSEYQDYLGDEIVGYRFATIGEAYIYDVFILPMSENYLSTDNMIDWIHYDDEGYPEVYSTSGWHETRLDTPVEFTFPDSIQTLWLGYRYYQFSSSQTYNQTPVAYNSSSTSHMDRMYWNSGFYDVSSYVGGDIAIQLIMRHSVEKTATPVITYQVTDNSVIITATGNGTVNLSAGGQSASGTGSATVTIPRTGDDQTITATATAQEEGKQVSDPATQTIVVPEAGRSPMPIITFTDNGDGSYTITATGTGEVALYINDAEHGGTSGNPIVTGQGSVSITVEQHSQTMTIPIQATNQEGDLLVSHTAEATYTIPALTIDNTFQTLDPQPANASTPIDMSKIMFVDRFSVLIPYENNHPRLYDYYLQETQVRQRTSNSVEVPVKHTGSDGLGFYTLGQLDGDTDAKLMMDVRNAAIDLPLESDPGIYFYTAQRGTKTYPDQADRKYFGVLQRTSDGNYSETLNPSYDYEATYPGGQHHIHYDTDTIQGEWNEYLTYVPVVWTMGFDRVLYESDHIHNSYGAPKWKTGVASVELDTDGDNKPIAERQTNKDNSVNWTAEGGPASLYILNNVVATATMPTVNTMPYEPYMFRIFVKSDKGLLRKYKKVEANPSNTTQPGEHLEGVTTSEAESKGPWCVWSGYVNDPNNSLKGVEISEGTSEGGAKTYTFKKVKVDRPAGYTPDGDPLGEWNQDGMNAMFGALDVLTDGETIDSEDLEIFVRFYYVVEGMADGHTPWNVMLTANGEGDPAGYGAESDPGSPGPATDVKEIQYHGEVVETIYYNVQGMRSNKPFSGVNIVVNRYSDGATSVSKVVR